MQNGGEDIHSRGREGPVPLELSNPPHLLSANEVTQQLHTDPENGLSDEEAKSRLTLAGPNELLGGGGVSIGRILMGQIFNAMALVSTHSTAFFLHKATNLFSVGSYHGHGSNFCNQIMG